MATIEKYLLGSVSTLLSTGLNSLANNALAIGSAFDNTVGQSGDGYTLCDIQLSVTFGSAPTANTAVALWLLAVQDGTNAEDGGSSVTPARAPDFYFPVRAVSTAQIITMRGSMPWGKVVPLLKNDGTGQSFASGGNTLTIRPVAREMV